MIKFDGDVNYAGTFSYEDKDVTLDLTNNGTIKLLGGKGKTVTFVDSAGTKTTHTF